MRDCGWGSQQRHCCCRRALSRQRVRRPAAGRTIDAAIKLGNDGGWCAITVNNNGRPFDAGLLAAAPQHGKVLIHTVGNDTRIDYTPTAHYAGADAFSVRLLPGDATIRVTATVAP